MSKPRNASCKPKRPIETTHYGATMTTTLNKLN
jgi:hypothetical protein